MPDGGLSGGQSRIELGEMIVKPRERLLQVDTATLSIEPLVMQLLLALSQRAGQLVTRRELFIACWGANPVGDDSLNRLISSLRKALRQLAGDSIRIETVPSTGYILRLGASGPRNGVTVDPGFEVKRAIDAARDSWRLGLPEPDHLRLEQVRRACALEPSNARVWGMLALLSRHAAEYAGPTEAADYVRECEIASRRATAVDPAQPEALTALASVVPLFGQWTEARRRLQSVLEANPDHPVATQDLATLEMATGRVRTGKALRDRLIARDPLAATFCYKSVYQHWSVGDLVGMDHVADRAIQLWPMHPAVWMVRFWTLAYTGRIAAALTMLDDRSVRPSVPSPALTFLRNVLVAIDTRAQLQEAVDASIRLAGTGPANAIAALFALGLLDRPDEAFQVAEGYYLRVGADPVPVRHTKAELSLNEQHRRLTQILFTPVFGNMRDNPRFMAICDSIGLRRYWDENALTPDFLA